MYIHTLFYKLFPKSVKRVEKIAFLVSIKIT